MYGNDWSQYMHELWQRIQYQETKINELEKRINSLEESQKENNHGTTIEKVEYKFDQLKIETLSGSLHIGLSPEDLKNMEDLALGQHNQLHPTSKKPSLDQQIESELQHWIQESGPPLIRNLASEFNRSVDSTHQSMIIQDIENQFSDRIKFYKEQIVKEQNSFNEEECKNYIIDHIKNEINHSLTNYMKNNKGENDK